MTLDVFAGIEPRDETWRVETRTDGAYVVVRAENGVNYREEPWSKRTKNLKRARRLIEDCQHWCERQNQRRQADAARGAALLVEIEAEKLRSLATV